MLKKKTGNGFCWSDSSVWLEEECEGKQQFNHFKLSHMEKEVPDCQTIGFSHWRQHLSGLLLNRSSHIQQTATHTDRYITLCTLRFSSLFHFNDLPCTLIIVSIVLFCACLQLKLHLCYNHKRVTDILQQKQDMSSISCTWLCATCPLTYPWVTEKQPVFTPFGVGWGFPGHVGTITVCVLYLDKGICGFQWGSTRATESLIGVWAPM